MGLRPLQFQKQLRLLEARRLILGEDLNASTAGYCVGCDDRLHFSREYRSLFGALPMRDVERLRLMAALWLADKRTDPARPPEVSRRGRWRMHVSPGISKS